MLGKNLYSFIKINYNLVIFNKEYRRKKLKRIPKKKLKIKLQLEIYLFLGFQINFRKWSLSLFTKSLAEIFGEIPNKTLFKFNFLSSTNLNFFIFVIVKYLKHKKMFIQLIVLN